VFVLSIALVASSQMVVQPDAVEAHCARAADRNATLTPRRMRELAECTLRLQAEMLNGRLPAPIQDGTILERLEVDRLRSTYIITIPDGVAEPNYSADEARVRRSFCSTGPRGVTWGQLGGVTTYIWRRRSGTLAHSFTVTGCSR
jgi:hypothetical protein